MMLAPEHEGDGYGVQGGAAHQEDGWEAQADGEQRGGQVVLAVVGVACTIALHFGLTGDSHLMINVYSLVW